MENCECHSDSSINQDSDVELSEEDNEMSIDIEEMFQDDEVQKDTRMALAKMIIHEQFPFSFVEEEAFNRFMRAANPFFKIPTRRQLGEDCTELFLEQKKQMKEFFSSRGVGRVSITTEHWSAVEDTNFICVTAHCIDKNWKLHRKIISFSKICSDSGEDVASAVTAAVEEWGLQKLLCCTMNDALENDVAIRHIKLVFGERNMVMANGKYLYVRCIAHVVSSVVCEGLAEIDMSVRRVREAVKWITSSTTRSGLFKDLAKLYKVDTSKDLSLDVPTEWNSTYLMLEAALPYERVMEGFKLLSLKFVRDLNEAQDDGLAIGVPEVQDWLAIKRMCGYLRKFHRLILLVSDKKSVTVHSFFKKMCSIFSMIIQLESDEDDAVKNLAKKMKMELGKYWSEETELNPKMNNILYIAALLDPTQKMEHVDLCLKTAYGDNRANELVEELNKSINDLFDLYKKETTPISDETSTPPPTIPGSCSHIEVSADDEEDDSEITRYFKDEKYQMKCSELNRFDILRWWSRNGSCYPVLSAMARDILAIPVSSVPSEAAFNTEGRVLSEFRSSLIPQMIEALICAQDWLKLGSGNEYPEEEENLPEKIQKKMKMVNS